MTKRNRNGNLLTTLLWTALVATLGFGLAGLSVQHLSALTLQENRQEAQNLARSVVSQAIERLMGDPSFCQTPPAGQLLSIQQPGTRSDAVGLLSFDPGTAQNQGLPLSTNNLKGNGSLLGALGRTIPKAAAQLVGQGRSGGVTCQVECVLEVPPFPYALAAAGPVKAEGGVTIGGLSALPTGPVPTGSPMLPADLLSNDASSQAVFLGANTKVSGDVRAAGLVALDPQAPAGSIEIDGQIKSRAATEQIPTIPTSSYDPQAQGQPFTPLNSATYADTPAILGGVYRRQGPLNYTGGLQLNGGVLFVDGDLTVQGGITGKGIVASSGAINVQGQSDLVAGSGVALLCGKDFKIAGSGSQGSYFQGLVYTEGAFEADRVSLVGTLIANGQQSGSPVTLNDARIFVPPDPTVTVTPPTGPTPPPLGLPDPFDHQDPTTHAYVLNVYPVGSESVTVQPDPHSTGVVFNVVDGSLPALVVPPTTDNTVLRPLLVAWLQSALPTVTDASSQAGMAVTDLGVGITAYFAAVQQQGQQHPNPSPTPPAVVTTVDPSSFLRLQDRVRVVLWKEAN